MQSDRVARARGKDDVTRSIRIVLIDRSTARVLTRIDVRPRSDPDIQLLAFRVEQQAPGPVSFTEVIQLDDLLALTRREILRIVLITLNRCRLADVQVVVRLGDAVGALETGDQNLLLRCIVVRSMIRYLRTIHGFVDQFHHTFDLM